jgi:hypothetical protein
MRPPRALVAWTAAFALLCAQALGLAHGVAHAHARDAALVQALDADCDDHDHAHEAHEHGVFDAHHDEGSPQCQLFDQVAHADGLAAPSADWTFAPPGADFAAAPATPQRVRCGCGYHARGPPLNLA